MSSEASIEPSPKEPVPVAPISLSTMARDCVKRLARDIRDIIRDPPHSHGIYYYQSETDMLKGYVMVIGPSNTPYYGGFYFFDMTYPLDYPFSPPVVKYCTQGQGVRFNPNLYTDGKVCVSLLNTWKGEQWSSCMTIRQVLLQMVLLLNDKPLLNEPGVHKLHDDVEPYNNIIEFKNIEIAVIDMLTQCRDGILQPFHEFYPIMQENFLQHVNEYMDLMHKRLEEFPTPVRRTANMFKLRFDLDYGSLLEKIRDCHQDLLSLTTTKVGGCLKSPEIESA